MLSASVAIKLGLGRDSHGMALLSSSTTGDQDSAAMNVPGPCFRGLAGDIMTWRELLWATLESPTTSRCASWTALLLTICISLSILAFILETVPELHGMETVFMVVEVAVTSVFTMEIIARLLSCPNPRAYCTLLNVVDLVAVLPLYLEAAFQDDAQAAEGLRIMRILRLFRIFKLSRYFTAIKLIVGAMTLSAAPLLMALFLTLLGTVLFASAMYYIERGIWSPELEVYMYPGSQTPSDFQSILDAMWWTTITLATVGYGDVGPRSGEGKALGVIVALAGVVILAFPISIFAANFSELYVLTQRRAALQRELRSDLIAGLSKAATEKEDIDDGSLPRFTNPHLPADSLNTRLTDPLSPAPAAPSSSKKDLAPTHHSLATPLLVGSGSPARRKSKDTMSQRLRKIASTHSVIADDAKIDADIAAEVFGTHPFSQTPLGAASSPKSDDKQIQRHQASESVSSRIQGQSKVMTPFGWSHSVVATSREARTLVEAVAIARAARRCQVVEVGDEDARMVRGSSFAHLNLADDVVLRASIKQLCCDARKRIWVKIRRREQKMRDAVAIELARRWRSWFDVDAETVIGVTEPMVSDRTWLHKEASVLSLAELEGAPERSVLKAHHSPVCTVAGAATQWPASSSEPPAPPTAPVSATAAFASSGFPHQGLSKAVISVQGKDEDDEQPYSDDGGQFVASSGNDEQGVATAQLSPAEGVAFAEASRQQPTVEGMVLGGRPEFRQGAEPACEQLSTRVEDEDDGDPTAPVHDVDEAGPAHSKILTQQSRSARALHAAAARSSDASSTRLPGLAMTSLPGGPRIGHQELSNDHFGVPGQFSRIPLDSKAFLLGSLGTRSDGDVASASAGKHFATRCSRSVQSACGACHSNHDTNSHSSPAASQDSNAAASSRNEGGLDDDDDDDDVVYRKRTVTRFVRRDVQGADVEETTEVLEEHRRRRRRRKRL